jgi:hypothetical protein
MGLMNFESKVFFGTQLFIVFQKLITMKKLYFFLIVMLSTRIAVATNEVPNPGFENWTSGNPDGWFVTNIPGWGTPITQYSPGYGGSYAAKGQPVIVVATGDTLTAALVSATPGSGFPITQSYATLNYFYQASLAAGDVFSVTVVLYNASNTVIAAANEDSPVSTTGWTSHSISIAYFGAGPATSASIEFTLLPNPTSSRSYPMPSSFFMVDEVSLTGTVDVNPVSGNSTFNAFPNPAHDRLTLKGTAGNATNNKCRLINTLGEVVLEKNISTNNQLIDEDINVKGLAPGIYSLLLMNEDHSSSYKILIE